MVTQLSEDERQELLRHLKRKWASLNTAYQKQPLSMDSDQKKHRKEEIERLLAETEKDISTLERGWVAGWRGHGVGGGGGAGLCLHSPAALGEHAFWAL